VVVCLAAIRGPGPAREVVHDLSYGTVTGFFAKARPQPPRMAASPQPPGLAWWSWETGRLANWREAKRPIVCLNFIFAGGWGFPERDSYPQPPTAMLALVA